MKRFIKIFFAITLIMCVISVLMLFPIYLRDITDNNIFFGIYFVYLLLFMSAIVYYLTDKNNKF